MYTSFMSIEIWTKVLPGYKLLDSGGKLKLEEVAGVRMARSEPRAWWAPRLPKSEWDKAEAKFESEKGNWHFKSGEPQGLELKFGNITLKLKFPPKSKHFGIFPEQASQWEWMGKRLEARPGAKVLSLFGYTGAASLVAAAHIAQVTHVDGSRAVIGWAREKQVGSGLLDKPIRWILDDAVDFVKREVKRGNLYDGIIMDPPSFGRGPQGQVWKVEEDLVPFLAECRKILVAEPLFLILNMYSTELSALTLKNLLEDLKLGPGEVSLGELALTEEGGRLLPLSIFANYGYK
jgi:23S rRNA (cytosine1962-C5)-methyltransferase